MEYYSINECCEILDSQRIPITANKRVKGIYPYYGANGIQDYVNDYIFDGEFVLVAEDGGNFGSKDKPIAYRVSGKCWVNNHAHILKPYDFIDVDYLCFSLMFYNTEGLVNGATRQKLNQAQLRKMKVPKLPLEEQKKIVIEINKIISAKTILEKQLNNLDDLIKSRFIEMFGDPIINERGWKQKSIDSICVNIYGGGTPSKSCPQYFDGEIPWVTPKDMKSKLIFNSIDHITKEAVDNSSTKLIPPYSVLMVIRSGILKHTLPIAINTVEVTLNQDMKAFVPSCEITSSFLANYFIAIEEDILYGVRCVTADNIDFKAFKKRMMIVPPLSLQNEFEKFVNLIDKSKFIVQKQIDDLQELLDSKMDEYFG